MDNYTNLTHNVASVWAANEDHLLSFVCGGGNALPRPQITTLLLLLFPSAVASAVGFFFLN